MCLAKTATKGKPLACPCQLQMLGLGSCAQLATALPPLPPRRGLQALHASNIIHRDIKPANIFLCQNDVLKIGDLGVAKALTR